MWPNFGKLPLWVRLKQLEFLTLPQFCWHHKANFKCFYSFLCNSKHFYCIGAINKQKAKISSCFSELIFYVLNAPIRVIFQNSVTFMYVALCLWVVMGDKPYLALRIKNMHPQHLRPYMEAAIETVLTCKIYFWQKNTCSKNPTSSRKNMASMWPSFLTNMHTDKHPHAQTYTHMNNYAHTCTKTKWSPWVPLVN